jgi:iron-sulfur cluster repair protein YtfE (RIC family)
MLQKLSRLRSRPWRKAQISSPIEHIYKENHEKRNDLFGKLDRCRLIAQWYVLKVGGRTKKFA